MRYHSNMSTNEALKRLDAAVTALESVDLSELTDDSLGENLDELSVALCQVDVLLSRLAEATRSRGFQITEPELPLAS